MRINLLAARIRKLPHSIFQRFDRLSTLPLGLSVLYITILQLWILDYSAYDPGIKT
jgi:hypothetical protein